MRKFVFIISLAVTCIACDKLIGNSNQNSEGNITEESNFPSDKLEFATISDTTSYNIANKSDMPKIEINLNLLYPKANGVAGDDKLLLKDFINTCLGEKFAKKTSFEEAVKSYIDNDIANYKIEVCGSTPENKIKAESWMNHEKIISNEIFYNAHGIMSYACNIYTYTGGTHGLGVKSCYVYDFYENVEITLNNIFKDEAIPEILSLIKQELSQRENAESISMDDVNVTENFYVDKDGISWVYNPYEIAPYALGEIEVKLPYSEIEKYFIENTAIKSIY